MEWTKEKPTKPGWYWAFSPSESDDPMIVEAFCMARDDKFLSFRSGWDSYSESDFTHWQGPLSVPAHPVDT